MEIDETYAFFYFDCEEITHQTYKGVSKNGENMYIYKECGCENYEQNQQNKEINK